MIKCTFEDGKKAHLRHVTVDALIEKDNQILLVKRASNYHIEPGKFALPGGFLDRDESAVEAVVREVKEETGFASKVISLFRLVDRPRLKGDDRQNVGFFFQVAIDNQIGQPDFEIESIHWFPVGQLPPPASMGFDHSENLALFTRYLSQPFPLPLLNDTFPKV